MLDGSRVEISDFWMLTEELKLTDYNSCADQGACEQIDDVFCLQPSSNLPMTCLTPDKLERFATWAGAEVPSRADWLYAATNGGVNDYPWGDESNTCGRANVPYSASTMNCNQQPSLQVMRSCSYATGNNVFGVCDLVGNVREIIKTAPRIYDTAGGSFQQAYTSRQTLDYTGSFEVDIGGRLTKPVATE